MCGCNKNKGVRGVSNRTVAPRNIVSAQNARTLPRQQNQVQAQSQSVNTGLNTDRRSVERKRREIILKKLGRL